MKVFKINIIYVSENVFLKMKTFWVYGLDFRMLEFFKLHLFLHILE